jgi:hypothetical protein
MNSVIPNTGGIIKVLVRPILGKAVQYPCRAAVLSLSLNLINAVRNYRAWYLPSSVFNSGAVAFTFVIKV